MFVACSEITIKAIYVAVVLYYHLSTQYVTTHFSWELQTSGESAAESRNSLLESCMARDTGNEATLPTFQTNCVVVISKGECYDVVIKELHYFSE